MDPPNQGSGTFQNLQGFETSKVLKQRTYELAAALQMETVGASIPLAVAAAAWSVELAEVSTPLVAA